MGQPYEILTSYLVEASKRLVDNIDIEELQKRNETTIHVDAISLRKLGFSENEIKERLRKRVD